MHRDEIYFRSEGGWCDAWLYRPASGDEKSDFIVMAHGLGGEKSFRLDCFAREYNQKGFGVLLFDYRGFGQSRGGHLPDHLIDPTSQLQDYTNALRFIAESPSLQAAGVHLWGFSFSGGHVLHLAQRSPHPALKSVYALAPFTTRGKLEFLFLLKAAFYLMVSAITFPLAGWTVRFPIVGEKEDFALVRFSGAVSAFEEMRPRGSSWSNETPVTSLLKLMTYAPYEGKGRFQVPVAVSLAAQEEVLDNSLLEEKAADFTRSERIPGGHFDLLKDEFMGHAIAFSCRFFAELRCCE